MAKRQFFLFALLLSIGTCFAQSDFREGYIINLSNDTVPGFINNKGSMKSLKKCRFKAAQNADHIDYSPEEINAFRIIDGGYYVSMEIEKDGKMGRYFIEKLVEGIVNLYYYSAANEGFYLMQKADGKLYELKNSQIEVANDDGSFVKDKKEYVNVLRYLLQDSPKSVHKADNLSFDSNAMIDLAQYYHNDVCDDFACIVYTKDKKPIRLDIGLYAGYSISSLSLNSEYVAKMNNDFSNSNDILFGLFLNIMDPNISERFSLQLDMIFQSGKYVYESTYYDMGYMRIPFSLKYTYPVKKIKPSLQLAIAYNKWLKYEAENIIPEQVGGDALQKRTYQIGFLVGAEFSYELSEKIGCFFNVRYEKYKGKPYNTYSVPDGMGSYFTLQESVEAKSDFISFSVGLQF